jgi:hypothetical protein
MGGMVTIWALHLPEGMARDAWGFVGIGGPCTSQKATTPEFPVTSVEGNIIAWRTTVLQQQLLDGFLPDCSMVSTFTKLLLDKGTECLWELTDNPTVFFQKQS